MNRQTTSLRGWTGVVAVVVALSGCVDNDDLLPPPAAVDPMFARYVSLGNSITAGFQSGGINDSTQQEAYPVLLGQQIGSVFSVPSLAMPGCPPPIVNIFTQERVSTIPCALREPLSPTLPFISNLAVPGAAVIDVYANDDPASDPNALTTFILGGRTQVEAAADADPTFASVWIGNNDVLGAILDAANAGNPALVTSPADFATRHAAMMDELDQLGLDGGILIGVVQAAFAPYLSQGRAYFVAAQNPALGGRLTVLPNCLAFQPISATDTAWVSVPFPYGAPRVATAAMGGTATLDCSVPQVVSVPETINLITAVVAYNQTIAQAAQDAGWAYLDPNPILVQLYQAGAIRPFPAFPPDPAAVTAPFGTAISRDGIHPSASTHRLVAQAIIDAINATYGTSIPDLP